MTYRAGRPGSEFASISVKMVLLLFDEKIELFRETIVEIQWKFPVNSKVRVELDLFDEVLAQLN